jgi:large subunit ribosomal protein L29
MRMKEINEKTKEELVSKLTEVKKNLFGIKFKKATGQLENYMMIYNLKKDIAKINTLIREKELSMGKNS